jgi:hypothetical protein
MSQAARTMFVPETQLLTPRGPAKAGSLLGGATILGFAGPARPASLPIVKTRYRSHRAPVVRVLTEQGYRVTVTPDHLFFVQLKSARVFYDLFLVHREGLGFVLSMANGQLRDLTESTILYERQKEGAASVSEKLWMLSTHRSLSQATYVEQLLSIRYGLPVFALDPRLRRQGLSDELLVRLLKEVDTTARAARLLRDAQLSETLPHFRRKLLSSQDQARMHYLDGVFYDPGANQRTPGMHYRHVLRIIPLGDGVRFDRDRIRYLGPGEPKTEIFERPEQLEQRLAAHARDAFADPHRRIVLPLRKPFFIWPASYLREGMVLPTFDGQRFHEESIKQVSLVDYSGEVLELDLGGGGQVLAGGILVGATGEPALDGSLPG